MEKKLMEKRMVLDVIDRMMSGLEWTIQSKQNDIQTWKDTVKEARENGEEPDTHSYAKREADDAENWLAALETVKKHLEKLI